MPNSEWKSLCSMASEQEIKEALWSIKDDKNPRPDGFNNYFFKKIWRIVGKEICMAIQDFFFFEWEDAETSEFYIYHFDT